MRRDLWRLGTPLLALAVSFVVILIIGAASPAKPKPSSGHSAGHGVYLTVEAIVLSGVPSTQFVIAPLPGGGAVTVLDAATLRLVGMGPLTNDSFRQRVPAGSYLVCLHPAGGSWEAAVAGTRWICMSRQVRQHPVTVTFSLIARPGARR